jgi:DNA-binding PadR family transcriptional regulator
MDCHFAFVETMADLTQSIRIVRNQRVMLDKALASLYGVETRTLLQAVRRNLVRFPPDFCFQLDDGEIRLLTSQSMISKKAGRGGRRTNAYAFTEQGVAMLSTVLRSPRAIAVNIEIMRAFVRFRELFTANSQLAEQLAALEERIDKRLLLQDRTIVEILNAIRALMARPSRPARPIGFVTDPVTRASET